MEDLSVMYAVEMLGITKRFAKTVANDSVNLTVRAGEIHSLLGENGAGKTTLMKILYGMQQPDEGEIRINGVPQAITSPTTAIRLGIAMVHQHFMLIDALTVSENVVLGYEPKKGMFFDKAKAMQEVQSLSETYGLKVDPRQRVEELPVGTKQRVEILKALYRKADILILDEPTAVLTPLEVVELFRVLRDLKKAGKTIIMITHKLNETMELADRATVLRAGKLVGTVEIAETSQAGLAEMMVGRKVSFAKAPPSTYPARNKILEIKHGTLVKNRVPVLNDLHLELYTGEILGLAGVEGNGQTELIEALTGLSPLDEGQILLHGKEITRQSPNEMIASGIGHIPEDRNKLGLVGEFSIRDNLMLGYQNRPFFQRRKVLRMKQLKQHAARIREQYRIRSESIDTKVNALSGGNQQKVVIGRVLSQDPQVIIAAQPTRGVDIGAIEYIHEQLVAMRDQGKAVLLISAELDEIRKLSDKIAVIYEGRIVAYGAADAFDEFELGAYMTSGKNSTEHRKETATADE